MQATNISPSYPTTNPNSRILPFNHLNNHTYQQINKPETKQNYNNLYNKLKEKHREKNKLKMKLD
jgi:hypothetical protein